ncbi:hypothetical protein Rhe02_98680 [Rhizocola hellebori]|uniref:Integrase catalytic domain-containing protein n=1 Tax=Rhizocola hellebori TaxID=1392758 RepID=A0A8J3VMW8_9ACTN|nr:hypothetical protein Rhe02_98680 [Rhizocola hellebori]
MPGAPGRSAVYRVLVRNGLIRAELQQHKRRYRRWQRDAPMQLWQIDIMGGVFLSGGRECKLVTGIDDHSRYVVMAAVVSQPSARTVCQAFTEALSRYGVPSEVLTDIHPESVSIVLRGAASRVDFFRVRRLSDAAADRSEPCLDGMDSLPVDCGIGQGSRR